MENKKDCIIHEDWDEKDEAVKETLYGMSRQVSASESLKRRIDSSLLEAEKGRERSMKKFGIKKVMIGVAAACLVLGMAGMAGSGLKSYVGSSSAYPNYTSFEDLHKAQEEVGYRIDAVETFSNGYELSGITIAKVAIQNEAGQKEEEQKEIDIMYKKPGSRNMELSVRKLFASEDEESLLQISPDDKVQQYRNITLVLRKSTYKFVPEDYELTPEDERAMEQGDLEISYGVPEVEVVDYSFVMWIKDGISYNLFGSDLTLTDGDMFDMAKDIIESSID